MQHVRDFYSDSIPSDHEGLFVIMEKVYNQGSIIVNVILPVNVFAFEKRRAGWKVRGRMNLVIAAALVFALMIVAQAQIVVSGIAPRTEYTDRATFTIQQAPGYSYTASLNGVAVPVGVPVTITNANFYELEVQRTAQGAPAENLIVPFIIISSARGSSETGLPPWTPLPVILSAAAEFAWARAEILAPTSYPAGMAAPLVVWIRDENGRRGVNGIVDVIPKLVVRRGVGSVLLTNVTEETQLNYAISLPGLVTNVQVNLETNTAWTTNSGTISANTTWPGNSRIVVQNLTVAAGVTLTIEEGSLIQVAPDAEIIVAGTIRTQGRMRNPVVFAPARQDEPWGGIELRTASARLDFFGTILTGGGADPDWFDTSGNGSSHRDEQPILYASDGARISLTDSAVIHGAGQAGHGENGYFDLNRTLIQGFITAGQYNGGSVTIVDSALIEFPADDDRFSDTDNDGLYLTGGAHFLTNSLVGWAKDDGIDAGSGSAGSVAVVNCWVESCYHEGMAWSEGRTVTLTGTVVLNCGQGIETGFGTPNVTVSDSLSTANIIGVRFGDNYDWDYDGFLRMTNSLALHNYRDVWGMTWDDWAYRSNQMDVTGNKLTQSNAHHPDNELWDAAAHSSELAGYMPVPGGNVGAGLALRSPSIRIGATNVPVRLSTFTTNLVSIDYRVLGRRGTIIETNISGTLLFTAGQTVQHIPISSELRNSDADMIQVQLANAENAELTGIARSYLLSAKPAAFDVLVPTGATWKYPDPSTDQGIAWRNAGFDDSTWRRGPSELGDGDGDEATEINIGQPDRFPTVYFRHPFVPGLSVGNGDLIARMKIDDGAVVYLNGEEVFRANMPAGAISYGTLASSTLENEWFTNVIQSSRLVAGTNLLAVEVHQRDLDSSDLTFDFELRQELPLELRAHQFGKHLILDWSGAEAVLEETSSLSGPWLRSGVEGGMIEISPSGGQRFYRLRE